MTSRSACGARTGVSILIMVVVGLQLSTFKSGKPGKFTWPFLRYCMYNNCYAPGPIQTKSYQLTALAAAGVEVPVERATMGMDFFAIHKFYIRPLLKGDRSNLETLAAKMNELRTDPITAFRLDTVTHTLVDDGVETKRRTDVYEVNNP